MKSSRPPLLLILIIAGLAGCFLNMFMVLSPAVRNTAYGYLLYLPLSTLFVIICLGGLGLVKKWAVIGYSPYAVIHQVVYLVLGNWNTQALFFPWRSLVLAGFIFER